MGPRALRVPTIGSTWWEWLCPPITPQALDDLLGPVETLGPSRVQAAACMHMERHLPSSMPRAL